MNLFGSNNNGSSKPAENDPDIIRDWHHHPAVQQSEQRIAEYAQRYSTLVGQHDTAKRDIETAQEQYDELQKLYLQGAASKAERDAARQSLEEAKGKLEAAEDALSECARDLRLLRAGQDEIARGAREAAMARLRVQYVAAVKALIAQFAVIETANRRVAQIHEAASQQFPGLLRGDTSGFPTAAGLPALEWPELFTPDPSWTRPAWLPAMPVPHSQSRLVNWLEEAKQFLAQAERANARAEKEQQAS